MAPRISLGPSFLPPSLALPFPVPRRRRRRRKKVLFSKIGKNGRRRRSGEGGKEKAVRSFRFARAFLSFLVLFLSFFLQTEGHPRGNREGERGERPWQCRFRFASPFAAARSAESTAAAARRVEGRPTDRRTLRVTTEKAINFQRKRGRKGGRTTLFSFSSALAFKVPRGFFSLSSFSRLTRKEGKGGKRWALLLPCLFRIVYGEREGKKEAYCTT